MQSKTPVLAARLLLIAGIGGLLSLFIVRQPAEPELNGLPLSYYLDNQTYGELRTERDARESICGFGTNAVPYLIQILDARESSLKAKLRELAQRQSLIRLRFTPVSVRQSQAALACAELGPVAASASPSLARLANDPLLCRDAITALAMIGPENYPVLTNALAAGIPAARAAAAGHLRYMIPREQPVPLLLLALRDPSPEVRRNAAGSLGYLRSRIDQVVPALTDRLRDPDLSVRLSAAQSLGWFRHEAAPAVPALLEFLREQDGSAAGQKIAEALQSIDSTVAESAGVK